MKEEISVGGWRVEEECECWRWREEKEGECWRVEGAGQGQGGMRKGNKEMDDAKDEG